MFIHLFAASFAETVPHVVDWGSLFQHVLYIIDHTLKRPMEAIVIKSVPAVNFSSYRSLPSWHDVRVNEYSTCSYSWSSTPDLGSQRLMRDGLLVKKTSKVLSILVGNDTDCVIPGLDATSIKQLLLLLRY